MVNPGEYRENGRIRATIETLSARVSRKGRISVSTEKWENTGEYREKLESVPLLENCPDEFRKRIESV